MGYNLSFSTAVQGFSQKPRVAKQHSVQQDTLLAQENNFESSAALPIEVADGSCNNMAIRCIVLLHLTVFLLVDGEDLLTSS